MHPTNETILAVIQEYLTATYQDRTYHTKINVYREVPPYQHNIIISRGIPPHCIINLDYMAEFGHNPLGTLTIHLDSGNKTYELAHPRLLNHLTKTIDHWLHK